MRYIFMNKNTEILDCEIVKTYTGSYEISEIYELLNIEYRPIHIGIKKGVIDKKALNKWFSNRKIPASRQNIDEILKDYSISNTNELILKYFGLSLSDRYWFKPFDMDISWSEIKFFENVFSTDVGKDLFSYSDLSLKTPDNTSDGWLKKTWSIVAGDRYLFKGGTGLYQQEAFNEQVAYEISKLMGFNHIEYKIYESERDYYSFCKNFIDSKTELIAANYVMISNNQPNHISDFE